ncbi:12934_t:CDS:2, partial [Dentiscutata erythropus]
GKIKEDFHWFSVFLGISNRNVKQTLTHFKVYSKYYHEKSEMAEIILKSCITPTHEFINDIKETQIVFGKAVIEAKVYSNSDILKAHSTEAQFRSGSSVNNVNLKILDEDNNEIKRFNSNLTSKFETIGGDDPNQWEIIGYEDIKIIFHLLNYDSKSQILWEEILNILGYRILRAGVESLSFDPNETTINLPFGTKLTKIQNLSECHIYASIMNKNVRKVFSLHVDFVDEDTTEIIIQLIQHKRSRKWYLLKKSYSFKICWIVVGKPTDLDFDITIPEYPVILRSYKFSDFYEDRNFMQISIPAVQSFRKLNETCILSTCVSEQSSETNKYEPTIIGTHFSPSKNEKNVCLFAYTYCNGVYSIDSSILKRFYYIFDMTYEIFKYYDFGQVQVKWFRSDEKRKLSYGIEISQNDKNKIFPGNFGNYSRNDE